MSDASAGFNFLPTGIGSVPFLDVEETCRDILNRLPSVPFWPQFVKRSHLEDMIIQPSERLPLLEIDPVKKVLFLSRSGNKEEELVRFYDRFLSRDLDYFSVSREHAPGIYALLDLLHRAGELEGGYIKGQLVGPVTFAASIRDSDGRLLLHDTEILEAMTHGLGMKALWQVRELAKSGRSVIIFLDEPYLSGFGSAFSPIERHDVIKILGIVIGHLREGSDALIGIHCCGNTDWSMLLEVKPDIINFDAFEYMEHFLLYRKNILRFLHEGGILAWGIVPTSALTENESVGNLSTRLEEGLHQLHGWGIEPELLAKRSLLTPACGMGTMETAAAKKTLKLLCDLSKRFGNLR